MATLADITFPLLYDGSLARRRSWPEGLVTGYSKSRFQFYYYRDGKPDITYFGNLEDKFAVDWELVKPEDYVEKWNMKP